MNTANAALSKRSPAAVLLAATLALAALSSALPPPTAHGQIPPADGCVEALGALGSGVRRICRVSGSWWRETIRARRLCGSPAASRKYYARRHTFTLDAAATVSVGAGRSSPGSLRPYVVLSDSSGDVVGRAAGDYRNRSSLDLLLLAAGTYTVEVTSAGAGETGGYSVWASWWEADACVRDLGALGSGSAYLSGSGVVAQDDSCTSSEREPDSDATFYARRHTFTLDAAATVSVGAGRSSPGSLRPYVVLSDSSGDVVGRAAGDYRNRSSLDLLLLAAGTYTVEVTSAGAGETGGYSRVGVLVGGGCVCAGSGCFGVGFGVFCRDCQFFCGRSHVVVALARLSASDGVIHWRTRRGRLLSSAAT